MSGLTNECKRFYGGLGALANSPTKGPRRIGGGMSLNFDAGGFGGGTKKYFLVYIY